jgi:hypothetical protein
MDIQNQFIDLEWLKLRTWMGLAGFQGFSWELHLNA